MKAIRQPFKGIYYFLLGPLYARIKAETSEEIDQKLEQHFAKFSKEITKLSKELNRLRELDLSLQTNLTQQVSDEFVKMYNLIEEIKSDRADAKLNVTLVDELVKIHRSIEGLKYEQNGKR